MKNDAVMKLTNEQIDSNDKLQTFVQRAKELTIPLFPETVQFTQPEFKMGAALVSVNTQLDKYSSNRDIYKNESGGFCLHLSKLNEIAQQAGLQITDSRPLERKSDEQGRVVLIIHQVKWKMKSVDGSIKEGVATGKYDYYNDAATKKEGQVKSRRKHADALAESNALTRAYNKAIAQIPQSFSLDELKKPFLIPYVIEDKNILLKDLPKETQMRLKEERARKLMGITDQLYTTPQKGEPKSNSEPQAAETIEEADYTEAVNENGMSRGEENKILAKEFMTATQKDRTEKILNLIELKGYKDPNNLPVTKNRIEKQTVENQCSFIEKLMNIVPENDEAPL